MVKMVRGRLVFSCIVLSVTTSSTQQDLLTREGVFCCVFRVFILAVVVLLVAWLAIDTRKRPEQLISFGGVCMFVVLIFLFSAHRTAVSFALSQPLTPLKVE